jgi:hypothetical protein
MRPLIAALLLTAVSWGCSGSLAPSTGTAPPPSTAGALSTSREDELRAQLEANYARIVEGFKKNDPSVWEGFLTPDFQIKLFNGQTKDRQWVTDYVRNNARNFTVETLSIRIKGLTLEGGDAVASVEQLSSRTFTDEKRQAHRLDVGAIQREVWRRTPDGLRLKFVEEREVLYVKQDGKPLAR